MSETISQEPLDVVGIGSMAVDRVHRCARILDPGTKGMLGEMDGGGPVKLYVGGVVLNHLGWAAALGLDVGIFGRQADDDGGRFLRDAMARLGIEAHIQIDDPATGAATSVAEIFVDDSGERCIYMAPGTTSETTGEHVRKVHSGFVARARVLSTEVSQLPLETTLEALRIAREAGLETIVDFDVPRSDALETLGDDETLRQVLEAADILKPAKLAGRELFPELADDPLGLARAIRDRYGNRAVVVTDGAAGCAIASDEHEGLVPGCSAKPIDTTGAGDAFLGGLLVGRRRGLSWPDVGRLANACGAACVEQMGAFPEDPQAARARVLRFLGGDASLMGELSAGASLDGEASGETQSGTSSSAEAGLRVLEVGADQLAALRDRHRNTNGRALLGAAELIELARSSGGRVHVTGLGKPEHVAHYAASLLSSTGTPATFLSVSEATHGSLGQVEAGDVVIAISNSGGTREVVELAELLGERGAHVVAVTRDSDSPLGRVAELVLDAKVEAEGGPLELAPRSSVAAEVLVLGALSALLQQRAGFSLEDYGARHPSGALGAQAAERSSARPRD